MNPKRKILFVVQLPPPVHGVSVMNQFAVSAPQLVLWEKKVVPLNFGQTLADLGKITVKKLLRLVGFFFRLLYTLIKFRPDVTYYTIMPTGNMFYRDALFILLGKILCKKVIIHLHGKGVNDEAATSSLKKALYRKVFKNTHIICLSKTLVKDISLVASENVFVLPNGIPVADHLLAVPLRQIPQSSVLKSMDSQASRETKVIIYLSNLVKSKGIETFLESLAITRRQGYSFKAKIVGKPHDYSIAEALSFCKEHDLLDFVEILGPLFGDSKFDELRSSDIFVLPSHNECFPLTILEAMQCGLAIIASDVGGIPDMITHRENGLLIKPKDANDLSKNIVMLLTNPEVTTKIGLNAQACYYENFTITHFHSGLSSILNTIYQTK